MCHPLQNDVMPKNNQTYYDFPPIQVYQNSEFIIVNNLLMSFLSTFHFQKISRQIQNNFFTDTLNSNKKQKFLIDFQTKTQGKQIFFH